MNPELIDSLVIKNQAKIVFLIMDGLGGLPLGQGGKTELNLQPLPIWMRSRSAPFAGFWTRLAQA